MRASTDQGALAAALWFLSSNDIPQGQLIVPDDLMRVMCLLRCHHILMFPAALGVEQAHFGA